MNIKNIMKNIIFVVSCGITISTQCMLVQKVKTVLNGLSTVLAITIPNALAARAVRDVYMINQDPVKHVEAVLQCETRAATAKEENFLRPHVGKDVKIRIIPDYESNDFGPATIGRVIAITDRLPGMPVSMTQIIDAQEKNQWFGNEELDFADTYIAAAQHEAGHVKNNDFAKKIMVDIALSTATTTAGVKLFKKLYPNNATAGLLKIAQRSLAKCLGGYVLYLANVKLSSEIGKLHEYKADDNVEESKRNGLAYLLDAAEFRKNNPVNPADKVDASLRNKIDNWLLDDHPSNEQRKQRLMQRTKKV